MNTTPDLDPLEQVACEFFDHEVERVRALFGLPTPERVPAMPTDGAARHA